MISWKRLSNSHESVSLQRLGRGRGTLPCSPGCCRALVPASPVLHKSQVWGTRGTSEKPEKEGEEVHNLKTLAWNYINWSINKTHFHHRNYETLSLFSFGLANPFTETPNRIQKEEELLALCLSFVGRAVTGTTPPIGWGTRVSSSLSRNNADHRIQVSIKRLRQTKI